MFFFHDGSGSGSHSPVGVDGVEYGLELWVWFSLLHHGQVVTQRAQTRLELLVVQATRLLLIEVPVGHRPGLVWALVTLI